MVKMLSKSLVQYTKPCDNMRELRINLRTAISNQCLVLFYHCLRIPQIYLIKDRVALARYNDEMWNVDADAAVEKFFADVHIRLICFFVSQLSDRLEVICSGIGLLSM